MIPHPGETLTHIAMRLAMRIAPELTDNFNQADAGLLSGLLIAMAQDYERAADNRVRDIEAMREVFAAAPAAAPGADERAAFTTRQPASYHLNDLNQLHAAGFNLLIDLHTWAELNDDALNLCIWRLLREHCERNKFELPLP